MQQGLVGEMLLSLCLVSALILHLSLVSPNYGLLIFYSVVKIHFQLCISLKIKTGGVSISEFLCLALSSYA